MRALRWVIRRRLGVIACWVAAALLSAPGLWRLENDNSPEAYFVDDALALEQYRRASEVFGDFEGLRLVVSGPGVWTSEGLGWLARIEIEAPLLRGVVKAAGLYGHHRQSASGWPPVAPTALREAARADSLDRNAGWISGDGGTVTLLLALRRMSVGERRALLESLRQLADQAPDGVKLRLAGLPVLSQAFDDAIIDFAARFFPLLIVLASALLYLALRSAGDVARTLLFVAVCQIIALGLMGHVGATLNMVVMVLIPLLFVLALATAIHVVLTFRRLHQSPRSAAEATLATYREKGWPVFWAGISTWVGFGSLSISPVPPVRSLGVWLAVGISLITLAAFTFYPALLASASRSEPHRFESRLARSGRQLALGASARRRTVLALFALAGLGCVAGVARLRTETSILGHFRSDHPVRTTVEYLESRGMGSATAELFLTTASGDPPLIRLSGPGRADDLERLARLTGLLRGDPLVRGAVSVADVEDEIRRRRESGAEDVGLFLRTARAFLLARDGSSTRIALQVPMVGYSRLEGTLESAEVAARELFPRAEGWVTGRYPLVLAGQRTLFRTMVLSLSLTFLCVAAIFGLILRDLRLTLIALIPNLWPVAFVLGLMGWLDIPIESATVAIAAVVLGLAVDDTLHFLGRYRALEPTTAASEAAARTLEATAGAHVLSSGVLAAGFGACGLSGFVPVSRFGALVAAALGAALLADLVLLPALLSALRGGPRVEVRSLAAGEAPESSRPPAEGPAAPEPRP